MTYIVTTHCLQISCETTYTYMLDFQVYIIPHLFLDILKEK